MKSVTPSRQDEADAASGEDEGAFMGTLRFTYRHSAELAGLSVLWTILCLPIVTVGPVTLGAYRAIRSLRETGEIARADVRATVRDNLLESFLLGLVPLVFVGIGLLYLAVLPEATTVSMGLGIAALYLGLYFGVILVPTFYEMAAGTEPIDGLRTGYLTIAGDPITVVRILIVTSGFLIVSTLLTVALVVIFPGITMSYHIHLIEPRLAERDEV